MPSIVHATSNRTTNCTLQWTQKLKEVNSFSAQYADAIYRACYQQPHNRTHVSCLLHSLQRKQFLCQTARSALICSIWKTCFPHDLQLLICSGAESAVCITQNAHNNQLWCKMEKSDTTYLPFYFSISYHVPRDTVYTGINIVTEIIKWAHTGAYVWACVCAHM
jgi:hypothetical protein